ncbi:MAG: (d)CMP kinase [Bacteroidia bacterium]
MNKINIAIDGFAGGGKSTTARRVADQLGYIYIDTGAMYRAVTLFVLENELPFDKENDALSQALTNIELDFSEVDEEGNRMIMLNGIKVEDKIRTPEVSGAVSPVSVLVSVRRMLVAQQKRMAQRKGFVMDGRDIGTVVLPDAELKVFMTADMDVRVDRRRQELESKGIYWSAEEIRHNMAERDRIDSSRSEGPLKKADDARELDTSGLTIDDQVRIVVEWAEALIH